MSVFITIYLQLPGHLSHGPESGFFLMLQLELLITALSPQAQPCAGLGLQWSWCATGQPEHSLEAGSNLSYILKLR